MYEVVSQIGSIELIPSRRARERVIEHLVTGHALASLEYLQAFPQTPLLYRSGLHYRTAEPAERFEAWRDIPTLLRLGYGNCKDFVPWRLAELWRAGVKTARASVIEQRQDGRTVYHVFIGGVRRGTEDPSRVLGMDRIT